jgi:hypothetical protein
MIQFDIISATLVALFASGFQANAMPTSNSTTLSPQEWDCNTYQASGSQQDCGYCVIYLNSIGDRDCVVDRSRGYPPKFCAHSSQWGYCQVYGTLPNGVDYSSSHWYQSSYSRENCSWLTSIK